MQAIQICTVKVLHFAVVLSVVICPAMVQYNAKNNGSRRADQSAGEMEKRQ